MTLGADGAPCNNNLDAFTEMRLAALIHRARLLDPRVMPARRVFAMATVDGARALGLGDAGYLGVGALADFVVLDLRGVHLNPCTDVHDPYSIIVYSARPSDVKHVVVDGRLVVFDRRVLTVNEEEVVEGARRALERVLARLRSRA